MIFRSSFSRWHKATPTDSLLALQSNSKGFLQSRGFIIGDLRRACIRMLKAIRHHSPNLKRALFCNKLVRGLAIWEKFLVNLL
jgi:hypothetical protein